MVMAQNSKEKPHYLGHRERMRKKFVLNKDAVLDYELLEILLFSVFSRRDTKEIAKKILQNFGSIRETIFASYSELKKINGIGNSTAVLICAVREIFNRMSLEKVSESKIITSSEHVIEYYKNIFWNEKQEQLRIMFLNNKNRLLSDKVLQIGTVNQTAIYPREIIHKALEYGASAMIMVHNHPSGDPHPSRQDVIITKMIKDVAQKLDIDLLDHLIIGKDKNTSLKELGII
jgi:DNA repair protein RadC